MRHALTAFVFVALAYGTAALAADPPRVEGLSNPQSQSIGKKACTDGPGPAVFVPQGDPCPGEGLRSGNRPGGAPATPAPATPRPEDPAAAQRRSDARESDRMRENYQTSQKIAEAWKHFKGDGVPVDIQRAFSLFRSACYSLVGGRACAMAAMIIIERPDAAWHLNESPGYPSTITSHGYEEALELTDLGCRLGQDAEACYMRCFVSLDAGRGSVCKPYAPWDERTARYQVDLQAFRQQNGFGRPPAVGHTRPAPPPVAAAPPRAPAAPAPAWRPPTPAAVPPPPQRTAAEWVELHKRAPDAPSGNLEQALRVDPNHAEASFLLGRIQAKAPGKAERDKGLALMQRAVALAPDNVAYLRGMGQALQGDPERWTEAAAALRQATEREPANAENWSTLVAAHTATGRGALALPLLDAAVARQPDNAALWVERGRLALQLRQPAVAMTSFQKAVDLDADQTASRVELARLQCEAGKRQAAVANFEAVLERGAMKDWTLGLYNECRTRLKLPTLARWEGRTAQRP